MCGNKDKAFWNYGLKQSRKNNISQRKYGRRRERFSYLGKVNRNKQEAMMTPTTKTKETQELGITLKFNTEAVAIILIGNVDVSTITERTIPETNYLKKKNTLELLVIYPPSTWESETGRNSALDSAISFIKSLSTSTNAINKFSNVNKQESQSIQELKNNHDIVIKEADKRFCYSHYEHRILH